MESKKKEIDQLTTEYWACHILIQNLKIQMTATTFFYVAGFHQKITNLQTDLVNLQNIMLPLPLGQSEFFLTTQYNLDQEELEELTQEWEDLKKTLGFKF